MKKFAALSLAAFLGLSIVGCTKEEATTVPAPVSTTDPADHMEAAHGTPDATEGGSTESAAPATTEEAAPATTEEAAPATTEGESTPATN